MKRAILKGKQSKGEVAKRKRDQKKKGQIKRPFDDDDPRAYLKNALGRRRRRSGESEAGARL